MGDGRTRYAVEIESLGDFLTFVDRELATQLEPGAAGVRDDLPQGQRWGSSLHGRVILAARRSYLEANHRADANLASYVSAGATMLDVIKRLMDTYRTSEEMAALTTEDVLRLFDDVARERAAAVRSVPRAI